MSEESCETCRFWRNPDGDGNEKFATCSRFPPVADVQHALVMVVINKDTGSNDPAMYWAQPTTNSWDWCGEYQARVPLGMVQLSPELDFGPPDVGATVGRAMADETVG